jgi:polysaccharide export outer membrane protein
MKFKESRFFLIGMVTVWLITSCASAPSPKPETTFSDPLGKETVSSKKWTAMNEKLLMGALSSNKELYRDYRIGPEDLLEISVFEEEKLNKAVRVSSQGNVSLPLIGVLKVKGLTANELEREIRDLLAEKYLQDPHVSVFIKEYRSQRISVIGAVEKPSVFEVTGQKTVLDALAMAGGLKEEAGHLLFLIRSVHGDETRSEESEEKEGNQPSPKTSVIDLEDLLVKGDLSLNLPLVHGDVVNVPVSGKVYVGGEVRKPGGFPLMGKKMTASQAVAMAEGLKTEANGSEARIFRYSEGGTGKEVFSVNVYAVQKGEAEDPYLKENDIIIVPTSGTKTALIEIRDFFKGIFGVGFSLTR